MSTSNPRRLLVGDRLTVYSVEDNCILVVDNDDGHKYELLLKTPDCIAFGWCVADVKTVRPDLTKEQAGEVLRKVAREHDATLGVTWETLDNAARELFPGGLRKAVKAYAERLAAAGDTTTLKEMFDPREIDLDFKEFANTELLDIYNSYIAEDEQDEVDDG